MIRRALVIGGGISGIQASLDIANSGYEVILVERLPSIGGHMAQLSETFPTLDCSQCILTPRTVEVGHHEKIRLQAYSEVERVKGGAGDFKVEIRRKASYVDGEKCTGCGLCQEKCPWRAPSDFEGGLGKRKAIYTLSPQAVPNKPVIDPASCAYFRRGKCRVCEKFCPTGAIDFQQKDAIVEEGVGAIVVATGYDLYPKERLPEYGAGEHPDIIDGLQFERLLAASGPTGGEIRRPSDGRVPRELVFIQCAGSRDPERGVPYCSKVCCMYVAKQAMIYKSEVPEGQAYVFYIDIRSGGKGYEEFVQRAMEGYGVIYLRGKVSKVYGEDGKVMVWGVDTLSGKRVEVAADLVVLATAFLPSQGTGELASKLGIKKGQEGFYLEAHAQMEPVESGVSGIYLAGAAQGPKDIPEAVAQGSAAAAKVVSFFEGGDG